MNLATLLATNRGSVKEISNSVGKMSPEGKTVDGSDLQRYVKKGGK